MVEQLDVQQVMKAQIARLRLQEDRYRSERVILEGALTELEKLDNAPVGQTPTQTPATRAPRGYNRPAIMSILQEADHPMRPSDIGRRGHEAGLIESARGLPGVQSIVSTVLQRNKSTFIRLDDGRWDVRARYAERLAEDEIRDEFGNVVAMQVRDDRPAASQLPPAPGEQRRATMVELPS